MPSPPHLTPEAARALQGMIRTQIGPGLTERELDAVEARFGFTFAVDHRVFLSAGLFRAEHEQADTLFDQVLAELGLLQTLPADITDLPWEAARWELVRWWLQLIVNGSLAPGAGGDLITYEGWGALARPHTLRPLVDRTEAYNDWAAIRLGDDRKPLADSIVEEAGHLLAGPWPPRE
ncbi:hypothetical protein GCM10019017_27710 [Streptomyces showdoensis]